MMVLDELLAQIVYQVVTDLSSRVEHKANPGEIDFGIETVTAVALGVWEIFHNLVGTYVIMPLRSGEGGILSPYVKTTALFLVVIGVIVTNDKPTYMLSFSTFKAPDSWKVSHAETVQMMKNQKCFTDESIEFMERLLERSGTGQSTAWPPGIVQCLKGRETDRSIEASRKLSFSNLVFFFAYSAYPTVVHTKMTVCRVSQGLVVSNQEFANLIAKLADERSRLHSN